MSKKEHDEFKKLTRFEKEEAVVSECLDVMYRYFKNPQAVPDDHFERANKGMGRVAHLRATDNNREATHAAVLRNMAKDPEEFKRYVEVSMPHMSPKLLGRPK